MMLATQRPNIYYFFFFLFLLFPVTLYANTFNWQRPYVGAYLGGGFANNQVTTDAGNVTSTSYFTTPADINAVNNAGSWTKNPSNLIIGVQAGHDWLYKKLLFGVALDYTTLPLSSSNTTNITYPDNSDQFSLYTNMRTDWAFMVRGRVGYLNERYLPSLLYLTGGMAMSEITVRNSFSDTSALAGNGSSSLSQNKIGWVVGAGVEVAASSHVSFLFEYLYMRVPSVNTNASVANTQAGFGIPVQSLTSPLSTSANFHANLFKIGVNYRFDES